MGIEGGQIGYICGMQKMFLRQSKEKNRPNDLKMIVM